MKWPIVVKPEAEQDLAEAIIWYEARRTGLGNDLLDEVHAVLESLRVDPERLSLTFADLRLVVVRRFPYVLVYRIDPQQVTVVAIYHTSRNPHGWQRRS